MEADENFSASISGLTGNTVYYIRSYVYGNSRYTYSETFTVTTAASSLDEQLKNYVAPTYEDYYVDIASWDQRNQWNLANVHDPTVVLAEDGITICIRRTPLTAAAYSRWSLSRQTFQRPRKLGILRRSNAGTTRMGNSEAK